MDAASTILVLLGGIWLLIHHYSRRDWYVIEDRVAEGDGARQLASATPHFLLFIKSVQTERNFIYDGSNSWTNKETQESITSHLTVFSDYAAATDSFNHVIRERSASLPMQQHKTFPRKSYPMVILWKVRAATPLRAQRLVFREAIGMFDSRVAIRNVDVAAQSSADRD